MGHVTMVGRRVLRWFAVPFLRRWWSLVMVGALNLGTSQIMWGFTSARRILYCGTWSDVSRLPSTFYANFRQTSSSFYGTDIAFELDLRPSTSQLLYYLLACRAKPPSCLRNTSALSSTHLTPHTSVAFLGPPRHTRMKSFS